MTTENVEYFPITAPHYGFHSSPQSYATYDYKYLFFVVHYKTTRHSSYLVERPRNVCYEHLELIVSSPGSLFFSLEVNKAKTEHGLHFVYFKL